MSKFTPVAVALGSNLGDRHAYLQFAITRLRTLLTDLRVSSILETDPVAVAGEQGRFLNAAVIGETNLDDPRALLRALQEIEQAAGRQRPFRGAARTLDLDLVLFGDVVIDDPGLTVPHPRFRDRVFVLEPLAEVAGGWRDPVSGETVTQLLTRLRRATSVPRR